MLSCPGFSTGNRLGDCFFSLRAKLRRHRLRFSSQAHLRSWWKRLSQHTRTAGYPGKGLKGFDQFYLAVPARADHGAEILIYTVQD